MALGDAAGSRIARSTAEGACALRAAGRTLSDPEVRNPDYLAEKFITPGIKLSALAKVPLLKRLLPGITERVLPGGFWFETARTHHMDGVLRDEVAAGATQVVILGAGLDSRAYRFKDELPGVAWFEVDHPVTAAIKRERLDAVFGGPPDHVTYVLVDFNTQDLGERMVEEGFDPDARSIVLWSGVAPYLEPEGVAATLRWFKAGTGRESGLSFDYLWQEALDGDHSFYGAPELFARVASGGEPFKSGIPRGRTAEYLADFGLVLEEDLGPEDAQEQLLKSQDRKIYGFGGLALARNLG
jgi:methyltransferase (TIGR00027 family)